MVGGLRSITVWITYHCNYECPYCIFRLRFNEMPETRPPEDWIRALNRLENPVRCDITGGEPLLYEGLDKVIAGVDERHELALTTNFSISASPDFYLRFLWITLSFHPTQLSSEEEMDFFDRAKQLRESYPHILTVNYVAERPQMHRIPELKDKCAEIGVRFHVDPESETSYTDDELKWLEPYLSGDRLVGHERENMFNKPRLCSAGQTYIQILPNGTMIPCFEKPPLSSFFDELLPLSEAPRYCDSKECGACDWDGCFIYDLDGKLIKGGK